MPEVVHRVKAVFQLAVPGGEVVKIILLLHTGLEICQMKLKPKLLTCSENLAQKYGRKKTGLSESCSSGQHCLLTTVSAATH